MAYLNMERTANQNNNDIYIIPSLTLETVEICSKPYIKFGYWPKLPPHSDTEYSLKGVSYGGGGARVYLDCYRFCRFTALPIYRPSRYYGPLEIIYGCSAPSCLGLLSH